MKLFLYFIIFSFVALSPDIVFSAKKDGSEAKAPKVEEKELGQSSEQVDEQWGPGTVVQLPDAKTLKERLSEIGFDDFNEKTQFSSKNANKELAIIGVIMAVELAYSDYFKSMDPRQLMMAKFTTFLKETLFTEVLLLDFPKAIPVVKELLKRING